MKSTANKVLMSGNHAVAEAAIRAGCRLYFGYPITPQNEIPEYMSEHLPKANGTFVQAESELAAINMVFGAAVTGARAMTSSSSPGISLKQEGISYMVADELPGVIVNMMRGGPGLGNISTSQSDYFQTTRGGGHGDYRTIALAPSSVQELVDLTPLAFDLADQYRTPVIIHGEGILGQMVEPVEFKEYKRRRKLPAKEWALTGAKGRPGRFIRSLILEEGHLEELNWKLSRKYQEIEKREVRWESFRMEDAKMAVVAIGSAARIAKGAIKRVREEGLLVGLIRPITVWPFPTEAIRQAANTVSQFLVCELNTGQMVEDVRLSLEGRSEVHFYGRPGGSIPNPVELARIISRHYFQKERKGS